MPKYRVYAIFSTPSKYLGTFEGTKEEVEQQVYDEKDADMCVSLCYHCSREVGGSDLDFIELEFEEVKEESKNGK